MSAGRVIRLHRYPCIFYFFFFQAEDGIRDLTVTGVQTCALPISNRFGVPYIAVVGNNSAMNQIRYGQIAKYGAERGNVGNLLGDVPFGRFAEMLGGYGEEVHDPSQIGPALLRARESVRTTKRSAGF